MRNLTSGGELVKNSLLNIFGQFIPLVVAFISIPLLVKELGIDRFGVLTLSWMFIGYFGLFDLGLGRALTQLIAKKLGLGDDQHLPATIWTSVALMFILGLIGTFFIFLVSQWLVISVLKVPDQLRLETVNTFYILGAAIPVVIVSSGFVGILSALQRFDLLNKIRIPMSIYSYLAPLAIVSFSHSLNTIILVLVLGRLFGCLIHIWACFIVMPSLRSSISFKLSYVRPLFSFGAWMTVTNIVGPLMVYLDRFAIGAVLSISAVAYYSTPYEMITKLWIIPGAIVSVLFPAFSDSYLRNSEVTLNIFVNGTKYVALILFPLVLICVTFAPEILKLWLGNEFVINSTNILQLFAIGVYINSIALVFITFIQAIGRPDLSAKLHFFELPIYLMILWWTIHNYGIFGAGLTWVARVVIDAIVLFVISSKYLFDPYGIMKRMLYMIFCSLVILSAPIFISSLTYRLSLTIIVFAVYVFLAWFRILSNDERFYIQSRIPSLFFKKRYE